jgi:hypothetical protein
MKGSSTVLNPWVTALNEVLGLLICIVCNLLVYTGKAAESQVVQLLFFVDGQVLSLLLLVEALGA